MKLTKRILSALTSAVCMATVCAGTFAFSVSAAETDYEVVTSGNLTCYVYADHVAVKDCAGTAESVIIPMEVRNQPVTEILGSAFKSCTDLTEVTIQEGVVSIGSEAFSGCTKLNTISIPSTVTSVGKDAFYNTGYVNSQAGPVCYVSKWAVASKNVDTSKAVKIDSGTVGIADYTFYNFDLESVNIPTTVVTIGEGAFMQNTNIREVKIPTSVKTIGNVAFEYCSSLLSLTLNDGLEKIGDSAFYGCTRLSGINIPDTVNIVGRDAFKYTDDYTNQLGPEIYIDTWVVNCQDSDENLSVNIKSGTKGIADYAFSEKSFVTSAVIPEGVKTIGKCAFYDCTALNQLSLPETLVTIDDFAFCNTRIPSTKLPLSVSYIGNYAFYNCTNLQKLTIMNPSCRIYDSSNTIYSGAVIAGTEKSTALSYANNYGRVYETVTTAIYADVDGDGEVTLYDVIAICKHLVGTQLLTIEQQKAADIAGEEGVDLYDAIAIAKILLENKKK